MGHWWSVHELRNRPGRAKWRCRRCKSETEYWKEPETNMRVRRPDAYDPELNLSYEETEKLYTCEELIVIVVHDI